MTGQLRTLTSSEVPVAFAAVERTFGATAHPADVPVEVGVVEPERFYAVWEGDEPVATAGSFDRLLTVPGAQVPAGAVTWVGVLPTRRRQGLLRSLMQRQLDDLHAEGKPVAALWASEAAIYGRYGYGPAAWQVALTLPRGAAFRRPVDTRGVELVEPSAKVLAPVYDAVRESTPGFVDRDEPWWTQRLHDPEHRRDGAAPLQCAVTDGGYALYATKASWRDGLPAGDVRVREVLAVTTDAAERLWRFLLDLDLMREVHVPGVAPDDPLLVDLLAEPRVARGRLHDTLHVRLVDVPAALAARRYPAPLDAVVEVRDGQCAWNEGRWHVTGDRDGASCTRSGEDPDLVLDVNDLGAAYLGGTPLRSRSVEERTPGALSRVTAAFRSLDGAPWTAHVF